MNIQQHGGFLMPGTKAKDVRTYGNRAAGKLPGTANTKECSKTQIGGKRIVSARKRSEV